MVRRLSTPTIVDYADAGPTPDDDDPVWLLDFSPDEIWDPITSPSFIPAKAGKRVISKLKPIRTLKGR